MRPWARAGERLSGGGGDAGIAEDAVSFLETSFSVEDGYRAMDQLLALCPGADAVFCATDSIALGALARLQEAGRQIPEEVALAGVGDGVRPHRQP